MKNEHNTLSIDAETNGLWGEAFSIAAVLYENGKETKTFIARCPIEGKVNGFVEEHVLPQIKGVVETHKNYNDMLKDFISFYMKNKDGAHIIVHMGVPVEARLFIDAHKMGYIGEWDAPYPLIDICSFPPIRTSVDNYNKINGIEVPMCDGGTHNPLYDSRAAALAYHHYMHTKVI